MKKIIIDCDPGHDDIMAILVALAHKEELEIVGISTVAGNQTIEKVTNNIFKVLDYLNVDIPVFQGCDKPLVKPNVPQPLAHGESGMDGPILPETKRKIEDKPAVEFLKETLENNKGITIVGLAPLTNIATLLVNYPHLKENINEIAIMGGAIHSGNINKYAEFNIWHDPEAAKIVFDSGVKVVMAPLEVCLSGAILISETENFDENKKVSKLVKDLFSFYCKYAIDRNWDRTSIFDVVPMIYLLKPELFKHEMGNIDIILEGIDTQGQTIFKKDDHGKHVVLFETNREEFINIFIQSINTLDMNY